jgi:dTDP-4-dehydrorhamnose 3,5-epimerase
VELFRSDELATDRHPEMGYLSLTKAGTVRGPHEHRSQTDLFYFGAETRFRLYLWDNRNGSPTFGRPEQIELVSVNGLLVHIPPGVVHAYRNIGPANGLVLNFPNRLYAGPHRAEPVDEIRHEDDPSSPFVIDDKDE